MDYVWRHAPDVAQALRQKLGRAQKALLTAFDRANLRPEIVGGLGLILGGVNFSDMFVDLSGTNPASFAAAKESGAAVFAYGSFVTAIINFLIIAFVVFMLVKAVNKLKGRPVEEAAVPVGPTAEELLTEIRDSLRK